MDTIMNEKTLGIDHTGNWTPAQYAIDAGWGPECFEATARLGVADADAEGLTEEQQTALLEFCRWRVEEAKTDTLTPDEQNEAIRQQVNDELPKPAGGFETAEQEQDWKNAHERRFMELVHAHEKYTVRQDPQNALNWGIIWETSGTEGGFTSEAAAVKSADRQMGTRVDETEAQTWEW